MVKYLQVKLWINNFIVYGNGHVYARDVIVKLGNLGNFVLAPDYNLMTIYELENYIKLNHHLPKIPSAKEVREKGMNDKYTNADILIQKYYYKIINSQFSGI